LNAAWNIWRDAVECAVFFIPIFFTEENLNYRPYSAIIGSVAGLASGFGIPVASKKLKNTTYPAIFTVLIIYSYFRQDYSVHDVGKLRSVWSSSNDMGALRRLLECRCPSDEIIEVFWLQRQQNNIKDSIVLVFACFKFYSSFPRLKIGKKLLACNDDNNRLSLSKENAFLEGIDVTCGSCSIDEPIVQPTSIQSTYKSDDESGSDCAFEYFGHDNTDIGLNAIEKSRHRAYGELMIVFC
jgi:hypothetical protein